MDIPKSPIKSIYLQLLHNQFNSKLGDIRTFKGNAFSSASKFFKSDLKGHYGCVNAIEFSNKGGELIISGKLFQRLYQLILFRLLRLFVFSLYCND